MENIRVCQPRKWLIGSEQVAGMACGQVPRAVAGGALTSGITAPETPHS